MTDKNDITPYEAALQEKKANLEGQIADLEARKVAAQREAGHKLAALPAGAELARKSALAPLSEIDQHIAALTQALADVNEAIAEAPALVAEHEANLKALDDERKRVDKASAKAVAALEAFLDANEQLRQVYRQYKVAGRTARASWDRLGRDGDVVGSVRFQWPHALHVRCRELGLVRIELVGDQSMG